MTEKQFINGKWRASQSKMTFEQRNPADLREVTAVWPKGGREDARSAIDAAAAAFPEWKSVPAVKKADLFKKVLAEMDARREEIAKMITLENGKTLKDSRAEVQSAYREMEYQIGEGLRLEGRMHPTARPGIFAYESREPLGVAAVISPWNFPFNVPGRKSTPALMAGNTVVFKPASLTPGVGKLFTELFEAAGFPPGVFNMVVGGGSSVGEVFTSAPEIQAVSFTGSTEVGRRIHRIASEHMIRTQLEMGGKNAIVVLKDADLDAASESAVTAAYACSGQWCTSTSRAIVESSIRPDFIDRVMSLVEKMKVGNGSDESVTMGPVCGTEQLESISEYLTIGREEGADCLAGGMRLSDDGLEEGCFIAPTVFDKVTPDMRIAAEEIFGPVLSILTAEDFDNALQLANAVPYGLSSSVYTEDLEKALTFVEGIEAGLTHVNMITAYKEPEFSFGGIKDSGFGIPEAGKTGIEFFTEHKVAYIKYR
jgi:aldehyde dehydrogenase (NAD+)